MRAAFGILGALLIVLFTGCLGSSIIPPLTTAQRVQTLGAETVAMVHSYHHRTRPMCTGTWVTPTVILTAAHCLDGLAEQVGAEQLIAAAVAAGEDPEVVEMAIMVGMIEVPYVDPMTVNFDYIVQGEVTDINKEPTATHQTKTLMISKRFDLAVVQAVGQMPAHPVALLAEATPAVGESIYFMGHQKGAYWSYMTGTVAAYRHDMSGVGLKKGGPFMQVQAPIFHGNSGGAAFNQMGQIVGMADFISPAPEMGFCIHLETIRGFLAGQHLVALKLDPISSKL